MSSKKRTPTVSTIKYAYLFNVILIRLNIKHLHSFLSVYCLISDDENDPTNGEKWQNGEKPCARNIVYLIPAQPQEVRYGEN